MATTTDLGACEWFVWDLRRSSLIERGALEQVVGEFIAQHPNAEPADLAEYLIGLGFLTKFQAETLLAGKTQGLVLGPYVVTDALGVGSMGTVYKAKSKANGGMYAVKVLPRRSMWNIRIARRKVRDFAQVTHPCVVPFVDVGTAGGMHYLVWPFADGRPLNQLVEEKGRLTAAETAPLMLQTAEALDACHQVGILHGLLKPSNLLVNDEGHVRVLDFGIGALLAETENESVVDTMSTANTMASGLDCASPEGIMDPTQVTTASDQYSLGCVMYYCLTGQVPFPGNNAVEKMMAHQTKQATPIKDLADDVPDDLVQLVERLMEKAPENRFPSMGDVVVALRLWVAENLSVSAVSWPSSSAPAAAASKPAMPPRGAPQRGPLPGLTPASPLPSQVPTLSPSTTPPPEQPSPLRPLTPPTPPTPTFETSAPAGAGLNATGGLSAEVPPVGHPPQLTPRNLPPVSGRSRQVPAAARVPIRARPRRQRNSSNLEQYSGVLIVVLGLLACVAGWLLANWL